MIDTIVIGAGISGITAARLLHNAGREVVILEARDRIGGRMWTDRTAGFAVDRGASWIHGLTGNPLTRIVERLGIPTLEFTVGSYQAGGRPITNFDEEYRELDNDQRNAWVHDVKIADEELRKTIAVADPGTSYAEASRQAIAQLNWGSSRATRMLNFFRHRTEEQCGAEYTLVDAHGLDEDDIGGDEEVIFPDGYDRVPQHLAEGLDIRLEQVVQQVNRVDGRVRITTRDSEYVAANVIVTVPLGVLKAGGISFNPELPEDVSGAIDRIEMGVFNKIFLRFPERFWDEETYVIRQLGDPSCPWHSWYNVSAISGTPTLLTFAGGDMGRTIEGMADGEIIESVLESLRRVYGDAVLPPVAHWITRWDSEEFTRGSYSYLPAGSTSEDHDAMSNPIDGVLHFAGEATWSADPATVHGALLSGHRAAERVLGAAINLEELVASLPEGDGGR